MLYPFPCYLFYRLIHEEREIFCCYSKSSIFSVLYLNHYHLSLRFKSPLKKGIYLTCDDITKLKASFAVQKIKRAKKIIQIHGTYVFFT